MKWLGWRTARGGFTGWTFFVRVGVGALDGSVGSVLAAWSVRESAIRNGWGADCLGWWINGMGLLFFHGHTRCGIGEHWGGVISVNLVRLELISLVCVLGGGTARRVDLQS